jgi:D-alanyl-D-alanine carboxypeptidase (penicillin-binding protein 5/6)
MRSRAVATALVLAVLTLLATPTAHAAAPAAQVPPPAPKAWILVDADTGVVLSAQGARTPQPPASTIKLLTALISSEQLSPAEAIPISATAEGMPARKINVKQGQSWTYDSLLHSMLMVSANDAAVAIAEKLGDGSLDGWSKLAGATADRLGLADHPVLNDPAGLDDEFSHKGGSLISPRDLAIVARAVLRHPELLKIVQTTHFEFHGGDGVDHELNNHDLFLSLYPGATGLKTGTTDKAGRTFVGTATRNGRTMLAVVFDAVDVYASTGQLLDQGFATPVAAESTLTDKLPDVVSDASVATTAPPVVGEAAGTNTPLASSGSGFSLDSTPVALLILLLGLTPLVFIRRRMGVVRE